MRIINSFLLVLITTVVLVSCSSRQAKKQEHEGLFPIAENGRLGFIDATGKIVITPQFENHSDFLNRGEFHEGLARAEMGGKYGFIDVTGKFVISPQYDYVGAFSEGLAAVVTGEKAGFVDRTGKIVISPEINIATILHSTLFRGIIFSEGLAPVPTGEKWGYIDKTGKHVITPQFPFAYPFTEGLARVVIGTPENLKEGYIGKTGVFVINPEFASCGDFSEGLAVVSIAIDKNREENFVIDKTGKRVIERWRFGTNSFSEGLIPVLRGAQSEGYIDKTGKYVISYETSGDYDLVFDLADNFSEGVAWVEVNNNWGLINKNGKFIIKPRFKNRTPFAGGLALVQEKDVEGYIDKTGKYVWQRQR